MNNGQMIPKESLKKLVCKCGSVLFEPVQEVEYYCGVLSNNMVVTFSKPVLICAICKTRAEFERPITLLNPDRNA